MDDKALELYIHIPFCVRKCKYCDFLSAPASKQVQNAYMEALLREIQEKALGRHLPAQCGADCTSKKQNVTSVFIGGGTPSVVDAEWTLRLVETIRGCYQVEPDAEISMEVNPGTVSGESLEKYKRAGINRLSIGCQTTDDRELARIGRIHTFAQFLDTYRWAREAGFENVNVDLMNALPGQTLADVERNLNAILALKPMPEHISVYSLIIEEGTEFGRLWEQGELTVPDEDLERDMYWYTADRLKEQGYEHYEISNFAKPGYRCRHNCGYWERREYLGFGLGAASLYGEVRFSNTEDLTVYLNEWEQEPGAEAVGCCSNEPRCRENGTETECGNTPRLSTEDQMAETMFLGLRMADGVSKELFRQQYGISIESVYGQEIAESVAEGLLAERDGRLALTGRGLDISNYVMAKFLKE